MGLYDVDFEDQKITDADFKNEDRVLEISEENMNSNYALFLAGNIRTI
jgi:hypothetical protein